MNSETLTQMVVICIEGMLVVFAVLILLWASIVIMHKCIALGEKKKEQAASPQPAKDNIPAPAPVAANEDEEELVAILTAAVAASLNTSTYHLKIKSFRRIGQNAPAWNAAARKEQIENQL